MNWLTSCLGVITGMVLGELVGTAVERRFGRTARMRISALVIAALLAWAGLHA